MSISHLISNRRGTFEDSLYSSLLDLKTVMAIPMFSGDMFPFSTRYLKVFASALVR